MLHTIITITEPIKTLEIRQSFSRKSVPYDNSVMESFFKSMKTEKLYRTKFRSEREISMAVKDYINYYNTNRPHSMLNYQTPNAYENKYFSKQQNQQC
jgi:transposase InsO family protein